MNCAACGKTGESLKLCTVCESVGYCNIACKKKHRKDHRKECKRMASKVVKAQEETFASRLESLRISLAEKLDDHDSDLWKSPERAECPICMLPLPLSPNESVHMSCCGKSVCGGCDLKNKETFEENNVAGLVNAPLNETCAFCRKSAPSGTEESFELLKRRMELNDADAWLCMARRYSDGEGVPKDELKEFECILRAAELGNATAYGWLAYCYHLGMYVDEDKSKEKGFLELAGMGGDVLARNDLGVLACKNANDGIAVRHWRIAAGAGLKESLHNIKECFKRGIVSKDEFAETLRAYQAAQKELKSKDRDRYLAVLEAEN